MIYRSLGMTSGESLTKYVHGDLNKAASQVMTTSGKNSKIRTPEKIIGIILKI